MGDNDDGYGGYSRGGSHGDPRGGPMRLNGRIMITAIVCLLVVVVIVVLLHIYARCVLRRQARRRAALRQLGIPIGITSTAHFNEPKRGLSESVIASLPSFVYKNVDHMNNNSGNPIECSVCLCTLEDEEIARLLPNCKHTFHSECIDMWLNSHSTCPICRTEAEPSDQLQQPAAESVIELGQLGVPAAVARAPSIEGTSSSSAKVGRIDSSSRLSSFRRMLSRERTETTTTTTTTRIHQTDNGVGDIERQ